MSTERETELKFLLDQAAFAKLSSALGPAQRTERFTNRYYSIEPPSDRKDWVLRLREYSSRRLLTLKIGREVQPGIFDSTEHTDVVESPNPEDWMDTSVMRVFRKEVSQLPIKIQGTVVNQRSVYATPLGFGNFWELDRTEYPSGEVFWELEVEVPFFANEELEQRSKEISAFLESLKIGFQPSRQSKYARFLKTIQER